MGRTENRMRSLTAGYSKPVPGGGLGD
jgi:hypothetical protein